METQAAVIADVGRVDVETLSIPLLTEGDLLIRVRECGICGSDVKMYLGHHPVLKPPLRPGHEIYGEIVDTGRGATLKKGDHVAVFPPVGCYRCENCRRGRYNICRDMKFIGGHIPGGLSEYLVVPEANVIQIPADVPEDVRVLIEPTAVAVHAVARSRAAERWSGLVVGAGPIGVLVALALATRGATDVILVDLNGYRVRLATTLGLEAYEIAPGELLDLVRQRFGADGIDVVFECSGHLQATRDAFASLRRGGELILVGMQNGELVFDGVQLQRGERAVVGVQMYTVEDFHQAIRLLAAGTVLSGLVTCRVPFADVARAFALATNATGVMKVVVSFGSVA